MQFNAKIENCSGQSVKQTIVQFIQVVNIIHLLQHAIGIPLLLILYFYILL